MAAIEAPAMHADDDVLFGRAKNGVVVLSGGNPSVRVDGGWLVIRDGPHVWTGSGPATPVDQRMEELRFTRAEASAGVLRHIVVTGNAGGFITFAALEWLRDTGVAISQLTYDGQVVYASGPRGPDQPSLRRAQALAADNHIGLEVSREILLAKLRGQAEVARLLGSPEASVVIAQLAERMKVERDGAQILAREATAAVAYWQIWEHLPLRFPRRDKVPVHWQTFGSRASTLTGKPWRATTPAQALRNYLYAILESRMTIALLAVGLDPGIAIFHRDKDGRSSLALDAMEAIRPYVDCWLAAWVASSCFAKRDFVELPDGEVRALPVGTLFPRTDIGLGRPASMPDYPMKTRAAAPLTAWLGMTGPLWQKAAMDVAGWLAMALGRAARPVIVLTPNGTPLPAPRAAHQQPLMQGRLLPPLAPPLPAFLGPTRGYSAATVRQLRGGLKDNPVPRTCWECGRAIDPFRHDGRFCSATCVSVYRAEMRKLVPAIPRASLPPEVDVVRAGEELRKRRLSRSISARLGWERANQVETPGKDDIRTAAQRAGLQEWYDAEMRPRLAALRTIDVSRGLDISRVYARKILRGEQMPHPRHFAALAKLAGVEVPSL
jgi:CRISPR-associated endonuclease Cas1